MRRRLWLSLSGLDDIVRGRNLTVLDLDNDFFSFGASSEHDYDLHPITSGALFLAGDTRPKRIIWRTMDDHPGIVRHAARTNALLQLWGYNRIVPEQKYDDYLSNLAMVRVAESTANNPGRLHDANVYDLRDLFQHLNPELHVICNFEDWK